MRYDKIGVELRRCHLIRAVFPVTPFEIKFINLDKFRSKEKRTCYNKTFVVIKGRPRQSKTYESL